MEVQEMVTSGDHGDRVPHSGPGPGSAGSNRLSGTRASNSRGADAPGESASTPQPRDGGMAAPTGSPRMAAHEQPRDAVAVLIAALDRLTSHDLHDLTGDVLHDLVRDLEDVSRRLTGLRTKLLSAVEAEGLWAIDGSRSFPAWLRRQTQASAGQAAAQTQVARALRDHLPLTADALASGAISAEHAALLAKHTTSSSDRLEGLRHETVGEAFLVEQGSQLDAGILPASSAEQ